MANTTGIKFGGREAGTPNKISDELRQVVKSFIEKNIGEIQSSFDQLKPKDKLMFLEKMLQYSLPKIQPAKEESEPFREQPLFWSR